MSNDLIKKSNEAYYDQGNPLITDAEFDLLSQHGLDQDSRNFRTKAQHTFPMGSLDKIKTIEQWKAWIQKFPTGLLVVMPKLDGGSMALSYKDGQLISGITRGDGVYGNLITKNIMATQVCKDLGDFSGEFRAEAIMKKVYAADYDKNLRNICTGMLGAKELRPDLAKIDLVIFDIYANRCQTWNQKRKAFHQFPGVSVPFLELDFEKETDLEKLYAQLADHYEVWKSDDFPYAIDGLVVQFIADPDAIMSIPELIPTEKIALKFQDDSVPAVIGAVEWFQGQYGKLAPVLVLETPVEIDSTSVQRISASNYALLREAGLGIGAKIQVIKANQIIPFVSAVDQPSTKGIENLPDCPDCGMRSELNATGVDAICVNHDCPGKILVILQKQIECFDIDFISDTTIEKLVDAGHDSLEKLFALDVKTMAAIDGFGERSAEWFVSKLHNTPLTEARVFKMAGLKGLGERKGTALLDHYKSLKNLCWSVHHHGVDDIPGFGDIQKEQVKSGVPKLIGLRLLLDKLGVTIIPHQPKRASTTMNVCATGKCMYADRGELGAILHRLGFNMVDAVNKDCHLLLCEDPNSGSSKLQKAAKLGVRIQSYKNFFQEHGLRHSP